jgi:hypothetical protein
LKNKFAALALAATLLTQVGVSALADDAAASDDGPLTSSGNAVWQVVSFPLRLVTGTTGIAIGAVGGGVKGIVKTEEKFAQNTFGKADENPLLVPVGLVGTVVAVPVGFVTGAPEGAAKGGKYGYHIWDNF